MNIAPHTSWLRAVRSQNLTWKSALAELIDNSFDASATRVEIELDSKTMTVRDDGAGCADVAVMIAMGAHQRQSGTRLGRYGVGLKEAALWFGGETAITTIRDQQRRGITVDWRGLERSGLWEIPDPTVKPAPVGARGTQIVFRGIEPRLPDERSMEKLIEDLGYLFFPALKEGRQIAIVRKKKSRPLLVKAFELPILTEVIDCTAEIDGKGVRIHVGIVPEGAANPRPGITFTHHFRTIKENCGLGCGGQGYSRIAGWVQLDDSWKLTKLKDDIKSHADELGDLIFERCRGILERASTQAMVVHTASLAAELTSTVRGAFESLRNDSKAKRGGRGKRKGTVEPTGSGKTHRQANDLQPGDKDMKKKNECGGVRAFAINFDRLGDETIGKYDHAGAAVLLSLDHPHIDHIVNGTPGGPNKDALLTLAVALVSQQSEEWEQVGKHGRWLQGILPHVREKTFPELMAMLLKRTGFAVAEKEAA